jgi:hyperosmotically inducible protein
MKRLLTMTVVALGLLAAGGCSQSDKAQVNENVQGMRQQIDKAADDAKTAASNAALESKVKARLSTQKGLDTRAVDVKAQNGTVTLKGDIASREQADMAERVARETDGVQSVTNDLMLRVPAKDPQPLATTPDNAPAATPGPNSTTR